MAQLRVEGRLMFHTETGTEGGYYAVQASRGLHGENDLVDGKCPWGEESNVQVKGGDVIQACPGNPKYWDAAGADGYRPDPLQHGSYYGLFMLASGDELTVYGDDDAVLWQGTVELVHQRDQYAADAIGVHGFVVHHIMTNHPDQQEWSRMFFEERRCLLVKNAPSDYEVKQVAQMEALWQRTA